MTTNTPYLYCRNSDKIEDFIKTYRCHGSVITLAMSIESFWFLTLYVIWELIVFIGLVRLMGLALAIEITLMPLKALAYNITLQWDPPLHNAPFCINAAGANLDQISCEEAGGTWVMDDPLIPPITNYVVYYGTEPNTCVNLAEAGNFTSIIITDLSLGTWYFMATAINEIGNESDYSDQLALLIADSDNDGIPDSVDNCPGVFPIKLHGVPLYFSVFQDAYNTALDGEHLLGADATISGDILFDSDKTVFLEGGYDCGFINNDGGTTTIFGDMEITDGMVIIESGMVTIE